MLVIERQAFDLAQDRSRCRVIALADDRNPAEGEHGEVVDLAVEDCGVLALATIDDVDAAGDVEEVVASITEEEVVVEAIDQGVVALAAMQVVAAATADQRCRCRSCQDEVVAVEREDQFVAACRP